MHRWAAIKTTRAAHGALHRSVEDVEWSHGEGRCNWEHVEVVVFVLLRSFSSLKSDKLMLILARQRCVHTICGCLCKGVCVSDLVRHKF